MGHIYELESGPPSLAHYAARNAEKLETYERIIAQDRERIERLLGVCNRWEESYGLAMELVEDYKARALSALTEEQQSSITLEAHRLVYGDRQGSYGHPLDDFGRTAKMWSAVLNIEVTPEQVGLCMCLLKISRECCKHGRDNLCDLAGYAETVHRVVTERERRWQAREAEMEAAPEDAE